MLPLIETIAALVAVYNLGFPVTKENLVELASAQNEKPPQLRVVKGGKDS